MILSSSTSSSMSSSSWSELPLDLLIIIREKLINYYKCIDPISFRSVCSQWHSCIPIPSTLPRYEINYLRKSNVVQFISKSERLISVPLSFDSSHINFLGCSNGWVVFTAGHNDAILHLFDPVSNRRLIFPCMTLKLLGQYYNKLKSIFRNARGLSIVKVVVSSNTTGGVAVVAIVNIKYGGYICSKGWLAFCRYGKGQSWRLLMEERKFIRDIIVVGDGRFYAIDDDWELYILEERPPTIILKRFKLMVPKHILEPDLEDDPTDDGEIINCFDVEVGGGTYLKIYRINSKFRIGGNFVTLKLAITEISRSNINVNVRCENFTPILKPSIEVEKLLR